MAKTNNNNNKISEFFNDKNLKRNNNNPNIFVDNTAKEQSEEWAKQVIEKRSFDPELVKIVKYKPSPFSRTLLVPLFDIHVSGEGSRIDKFNSVLEFSNKTSNAIAFTGGDLLDNATLLGATNAHTSKLNPLRATDVTCKLIGETVERGKMAAIIGGNHDSETGSRNKDSNSSGAKEVADRFGLDYVPFGMLMPIELPIEGTKKTKTCFVFAFHCSGKSASQAGAIDTTYKQAMNVLRKNGVVPDIIIGGHFHAGVNGVILEKYPVLNNHGKVIALKRKEIQVISSNSLQGPNSYSGANNMSATETNVFGVEIGWKQNDYYKARTNKTEEGFVREEEEYILEVCKFPILRKNSTELSTPAKFYSTIAYPDKTTEIAKDLDKRFADANLTALIHKFSPQGGKSK